MEKRLPVATPARERRAVRRTASLKKRIKTAVALLLLLLLSGVAVGVIYLVVLFWQVSRSLPQLAVIGNTRATEPTKIYYADGPLMAVLATENRRPVKLEQISPFLIDATIAIEDSRFYAHRGVDYYGIARALYRNVSGGNLRGEGASTITQQLARNLSEFGLTREKRLRRKIAEAILAVRIEQTFSKNEILELYLNQIYYGNGAYGAEAAARVYFHKSAKQLTLAEAAMLAGLPQRPSYYPENPDAAYRRRDAVLLRMLETGKITREQYDKARSERLKLVRAGRSGTRIFGAHYVVDHVVGRLVREYGYDSVYSGWKIYTTVDSQIQKEAEKALRRGIGKYGAYANQGALVCIEPKTGYVRAMVGGIDYRRDQFNAVTQGRRQPGSAFKPIVYTAAIDMGVCRLDSYYPDSPLLVSDGRLKRKYPKNYSGKYSYASVSVLNAIKRSLNTVAVRVALDVGLTTVIEYAKRMGIHSELAPYAPLALGASAVRPIELCSAYSLFANEGKRAIPMTIMRVEAANGDLIEENYVQIDDPRLNPETVEAINKALEEVVKHGTGTAAAPVPNAHGKTGTTSDNIDAWFAGYTPELATVVWVAREQRDRKGRVVKYLEMPGATGGQLCAPIWRDFMLAAIPRQQAINKMALPPLVKALEKKQEEGKKPSEMEDPGALTNRDPDAPIQSNEPPTASPEAEPITSTPSPEVPAPNLSPPITRWPTPSPVPSTGSLPRAGTMGAGPSGLREPSGRLAAPPGRRLPIGSETAPRLSEPAFRPAPSLLAPRPGAGGEPSPRAREPSGRPTAPARDPGEEVVTVTLCSDSMRRATAWCDATIDRRMRRRDVPGPCRTHRPPPGEVDR